MKLSIIIPMYNSEKFIAKCLESCISNYDGQKHLEVIVIDDGSTDRGADIVREYCSRHKFIKLISQKNSGPGAARNSGIDEAEGDYIWFIDADDWILDGSIPKIITELDTSDDILAFGRINFEKDCVTINDLFSYDKESRTDGISFINTYNEHIRCNPPYYIFRKKFLNDFGIRFIPGIVHEDTEFFPRVFFFAKSIKCLSGIYYGRRLHESSIMHTINAKRVFDTLTVLASLRSFYENNVIHSKCDKAFCSIISNVANSGCKVALQIGGDVRVYYDKEIHKFGWFEENLLHSSKLKYRVEGVLLKCFPGNYSTIHCFLLKFK